MQVQDPLVAVSGLVFASQNCNSLNMTHSTNQNQRIKIDAITGMRADIIFLSDLRLGNKNMSTTKGEISNMFLINNSEAYNFLANSTRTKRGVGILLKKNLSVNISNTESDPDENFLIVKVSLNGITLILVSIYGPNNHDPHFFQLLYRKIKDMGTFPIIIGGDFNATFSPERVQSNIDCHNMTDVPNFRHSAYINDFCDALQLTDPYRLLYPTKREYSYRPFGTQRKNRSRIDFFLASRELLTGKFDCIINSHTLATLFDHKPIFLTFPARTSKKRGVKHLKINESILRDPDIDIVLWYTVFETYLHYLRVDPDLMVDLNDTLLICGRVRTDLFNAGPDPSYYVNDLTVEKLSERITKMEKIDEIINLYPVELMYNFQLNINDDLFMEVLLNNIRNEVTSYQSFISKFKKKEFEKLQLELLATVDPDKVDAIEYKLSRLNEAYIRDRLMHTQIFDIVNNEKMTPYFLKLASVNKNTGSLSVIKNDNGEIFEDEQKRRDYILTEYGKIYGKSDGNCTVDDITEFLGPEICQCDTVINKKLTDEFKREMDLDLSLHELDNALSSAKLTSAGGMDGINNRALKKFWKYLRIPLYNYAKLIPINEKVTESFSSACIKLIPKKGDLTMLKNWRPISLLNCVYKVISRAVNNRLQKIAPFLLSRAQKGFVKNRYIQECLINIIEKIAHCNNNGIPALVVAIDQSRAFDTVGHNYMTAVYRFFNLGEKFISLMNGIGTNRTACIMWEDGSYSSKFDLKSGRAQGDGPSPLQYNMAEQILLFKLEFDPRIRPAINLAVEASRIPDPLPWFQTETNKKTNKVEALADDTTVVIKCCFDSILTLKNVLEKFGNLSGLECNFEKTCVMPVGGLEVIPFVIDLGFICTNRIKLLGLDIDNKLNFLDTVHVKTIEKIGNIIRFWSRFNLSLPGRINIVKTLCLSQINYIGCIITPSEAQIFSMTEQLEKFVNSKMTVSRDRMYAKIDKGGLGLIEVKSFIQAQQVLWIKRLMGQACDNWREDVYNLTFGNPLVLDPALVCASNHPIITMLAKSFVQFKSDYYKVNLNYKKSHLYLNPVISRGQNDTRGLDGAIFVQIPEISMDIIVKIRWCDFYKDGPVALANLNENRIFGVNLNLLTYMRLAEACRFSSMKLNRHYEGKNETSLALSDFFKTFKKGSSSIRKILSKSISKLTINKNPCVRTFLRLTTLTDTNETSLKLLMGIWGTGALPNPIREFSFKFCNNILGINTRLSHFVADRGRGCVFCTLKGADPAPDETFRHLFYECQNLTQLRDKFYAKYFLDLGDTLEVKKHFWFGVPPDTTRDKKLCIISALVIQFGIWSARLKGKMPSFLKIEMDLLLVLSTIYKLDRKIVSNDASFSLSRNFVEISRDVLH
jgi:exonuclease III